jgi:hypothetical protein
MALTEEEAGAEGVGWIEGELVSAGAVGTPFNLRHDRGNAADVGGADDAGAKLRSDHAPVDELLASRKPSVRIEQG